MNTSFKVSDLLASVSEQMWLDFNQTLIAHGGELGSGREEVIRQFLSKHLPKRFGISTGFIFDCHGNVSRQMDVIIHDTINCPKFEVIGGKFFFPCESVVCVGEVKSAVSSVKKLNQAFENISSVKALDRNGDGENYSVRYEEKFDYRSNHLHQIFGFIFVIGRCLTERSVCDALEGYTRNHEPHLWPNVIFNFDKFVMTYSCEDGCCPNPMHANGISVMSERPRAELLMYFYLLVARAIEVTRVSPFSYWQYLNIPNYWPFSIRSFRI